MNKNVKSCKMSNHAPLCVLTCTCTGLPNQKKPDFPESVLRDTHSRVHLRNFIPELVSIDVDQSR